MSHRTLKRRLIFTSLGWIAVSLSLMGVFLLYVFYAHLERQLDHRLTRHLEEMITASEFPSAGELTMLWPSEHPVFHRPLSGWYWMILDGETIVARSQSLLDGRLDVTPPAGRALPTPVDLLGPEDVRLRGFVQNIAFPERDGLLTYVVTAPKAYIEQDVFSFGGMVLAGSAVLALALLGVIVVQVGYGLRPLRALQSRVADVRAGREKTLPDAEFPEEVQPVILELNELLDYNATLLERARSQVSNLAHALKTPLTILIGEAGEIEGEKGALMRKHLTSVSENIDNYLTRARISGARVLGAQTDVAAVAADVIGSMALLHRDRALRYDAQGLDGLRFHGDPQDFEEILANLIDNASKWASSRIAVSGRADGHWLILAIDDDGKGVADDQYDAILRRGLRLDETVRGSGLGLPIVRDVVEYYGGKLTLRRSDLGGLRAEFTLPALTGDR